MTTLESGAELGNLVHVGDRRYLVERGLPARPRASTATALLIALALAAAIMGGALAIAVRAWPLLLAAASTVLAALVFVTLGSPWVGAKALAIGSPFVLLAAVCGCLGHASPQAASRPASDELRSWAV